MRKIFLSMAAVALSAASVFAQETTTFSFTGTGDVYGLTRTSSQTAYIPSPTTLSQDNIAVELSETSGSGFVLYSGGYLMSSGTNKIVIGSNNNATITEVRVNTLRMMGAVTCTEGSVAVSGMNRIWTGESTNLELTITGAGNRITAIQISYEGGGAVKGNAGLSFSENSVDVIFGMPFETPELSNPNNLSVTWESSNTDVATVDTDGKVSVVGAGKAVITASSEETDAFLAGKATYSITVVPVVTNLSQLLSQAAVVGESAYIDTPLTVAYATPIALYVTDAEGNATRLNINNTLETGDIIPAGWMATNSNASNYVQYKGELPAVVEKVENLTYPVVDTITLADNNRVVVLSKVNFEEATESDNAATFVGTVNGQSYTFRNNFMISAVGAGVYDVTLAVKAYYSNMYAKDMYELSPISYAEPQVGPSTPTVVEKSDVIDFTIMDMPAASTAIPASDLPKVYETKNVSYTLVSGTNSSAPFRERKGNGIMLPAGTEVMTAACNGKTISKIDIKISGDVNGGIKGNDIPFVYDSEYDAQYFTHYIWTRPEGDTTTGDVTIEATVGTNQWMKSVTIYYLEETSGLPLADLSFSQTSQTVSKAVSPFDASQYLVNPYKVPVTWSSSDESIAVPTSEGFELKAAGTVTLTASVNSSEFEPEEVDFTLIVVDAAMDIDQMLILAPEAGDKVQVYKDLTLYVSGALIGLYTGTVDGEEDSTPRNLYEAYMFMEDKNGNPVLFTVNGETSKPSYRVDDLFEGGYTATNATEGDMTLWRGLPMNDSRALGWFNERQYVASLANVALNKVVVLQNVTLAAGAPAAKGTFTGVVNDENLTLQNLVNGDRQISGVYDILGAPGVNADGELVFYPITYTLVKELNPSFPSTINITTDSENVNVMVDFNDKDEEYEVYLSGVTDKENGVTVTIEVPEGWSNILSMVQLFDASPWSAPAVKRAAAPEWESVDAMTEAGFTLGNVLTIPNKPAIGGIFLVYGNKVDMANSIRITSNVSFEDKDPSAVNEIEAVDAEAVYYTLQGVAVENPANGIFVKVLNGKATKVAIK